MLESAETIFAVAIAKQQRTSRLRLRLSIRLMLGIGLRLQRNVILHSNNTQYSHDPDTIVDPSGDIATEVT